MDGTTWMRHNFTVHSTAQEMVEYFLLPFEQTVTEGGALGIMVSSGQLVLLRGRAHFFVVPQSRISSPCHCKVDSPSVQCTSTQSPTHTHVSLLLLAVLVQRC